MLKLHPTEKNTLVIYLQPCRDQMCFMYTQGSSDDLLAVTSTVVPTFHRDSTIKLYSLLSPQHA